LCFGGSWFNSKVGEDNIRMDHREVGWEDVDWDHLDQDRNKMQAVVNMATNL
jgi:hypothetical protein